MTEPGLSPDLHIFKDALHRHAYAHDASPYLLIPTMVIKVDSEAAICACLRLAKKKKLSLTFRAAGTSLSGQAQTDSILVVLGNHWRGHKILANGEIIYLEPGVIGSEANLFLAPYRRKIGPDPASLNACKIGGIAANNASGMCCGIDSNSYHTLHGMRLILADGTLLDTHTSSSVAAFRKSHASLLEGLTALRQSVLTNPALRREIASQYQIKNTLGYSLNALTDFTDPVDILTHLMIGSEGTLGFIAGISYKTLPTPAFESAALVFFGSLEAACAASLLLPKKKIAALEVMDAKSLQAAKLSAHTALPLAALLIDLKAESEIELQGVVEEIRSLLPTLPQLVHSTAFVTARAPYHQLWNIRKGIFPAIAAARTPGTALINEDVAVPPLKLPAFCKALRALFAQYDYRNAAIFGHVKEGNLHFLLEEDFDSEAGIAHYDAFMRALVDLVLTHDGALKAEHGTGRNMAPFVEKAWGSEAYALMKEIKRLLDPDKLLNPNVILSADPALHRKHLKTFASVDPLVDACIECGFCEKVCPSKNLSLTPRQRIAVLRDAQKTGRSFKGLAHQAIDTCAKTGLCELSCPVHINTGALMGKMLEASRKPWQKYLAAWMAKHFGRISRLISCVALRKLSPPPQPSSRRQKGDIIYFPSCSERMLDKDQTLFEETLTNLLATIGNTLIMPRDIDALCCGLSFKSKGFPEQALQKSTELESFLWTLSCEGTRPILCETASCLLMMKDHFTKKIPLFDVIEYLADTLPIDQLTCLDKTVMLHITCSLRHLKLEDKVLKLAQACAKNVITPADIHCCGFAGDKGFFEKALNKNALATLKSQIPPNCTEGYSMSPSCQIGLSKLSGIPYRSLVYLIAESRFLRHDPTKLRRPGCLIKGSHFSNC